MQPLTFLFLLLNALYFVHAAMVPHDVDIAPRQAAESTTSFPAPLGSDVEVYPTDFTLGAAAAGETLTVVFSESSSAELRARYIQYCEPQELDYSDCSNALTQVVGSQPSIKKRFTPSRVEIVLGLIALIFVGVATFLSSSANTAATTPIAITIPPSAISEIQPSAPITNQVEVTCWPQTDCTGDPAPLYVYDFTNIAATTSPNCYSQKNCQCITYNSTNVAIQVWNGGECTGRSSYAYAPSGCNLQRTGQAKTAGTNSLNFLPVC